MKFDEFENIEVPEEVDVFIKNGVKKAEKIKKKRKTKKIVVAAATLVLCCGVLVNDNTWALVDSITKKIEDYLGADNDEFEEYKTGVEQSASDHNVTMTLKEVMLEDGEFILNMNLDFSKIKLGKGESIINYMPQIKEVYIDGKKFLPSSVMQEFGISESESIDNIKKKDNIDFLTRLQIDSVEGYRDRANNVLENLDKNKDYNVKIVFGKIEKMAGNIDDSTGESIKGNWEFNFTVNAKEMKKKTKVYNVDKEIEIKEKNKTTLFKFKELRISPIYARLYFDAESVGSEDFLNNISIEVIDQAGNLILEGISGGSAYVNGKNKYINLVSEQELYQGGKKIDTDKIEYVKIIPVKLTEGGSVAKRYKDKAIIVNLK